MSAVAEELRDSLNGARGLPGSVCRTVGGHHVYRRDDQDWLSTGTVLKIMGVGRLPEDVNPAAVEYGRQRGTFVDEAVRLWIEEGRPPVGPFAEALDEQLAEWREQDVRWRRFRLRPYVEAFAGWLATMDASEIAAQQLVEDRELGVFGWRDVALTIRPHGWLYVADVKTSVKLTLAHRLQVASYCPNGGMGVVLQLTKDGRAVPTCSTDEDRATFATLARCAHRYIAEQA